MVAVEAPVAAGAPNAPNDCGKDAKEEMSEELCASARARFDVNVSAGNMDKQTIVTTYLSECTMRQKRKRNRQNSHLTIIHFPLSEGVSEMCERANE